jgi:hypothetical protein
MVTRAGLLDALRADPGGGPALQEGMELGVLLGVLGAESAAPRLRFLVLRAEAKGKCLFHTCADADPAGRSAEELFTAVTEGLAADWDKPCAVAGYEGLTVGKALEEDHGVPLADAAAYLAFRHARPYCRASLPALTFKAFLSNPYGAPRVQAARRGRRGGAVQHAGGAAAGRGHGGAAGVRVVAAARGRRGGARVGVLRDGGGVARVERDARARREPLQLPPGRGGGGRRRRGGRGGGRGGAVDGEPAGLEGEVGRAGVGTPARDVFMHISDDIGTCI